MERLTLIPELLRPRAAALFVAGCMIGAAGPATAGDATVKAYVTVHAQAVSHELQAYGQVEPIAVVQVRAVDPGTLSGLRVVPGSEVRDGEVLARIGGPRMQSLLIAREQTLRSAKAREEAASRSLQIVRSQFAAQLATRQAVDAAQSDLAAARATVQTADAQWQEVRKLKTVRAPAAGTVLTVRAADGEQVAPGQGLVTLQPAGKLWIRAAYYGADAARLHVGMTGRFQPSGDGEALPVKVAAISPAMAADAGVHVGLVPKTPEAPRWWISGQWGKLTLEEATRRMVMVPTQALVLDRGHWWVLLHTRAGNKPQQVVPGPTQGWQTAIASGLQPGQQVVVTGAFLEYHRGIAHSYTPPD